MRLSRGRRARSPPSPPGERHSSLGRTVPRTSDFRSAPPVRSAPSPFRSRPGSRRSRRWRQPARSSRIRAPSHVSCLRCWPAGSDRPAPAVAAGSRRPGPSPPPRTDATERHGAIRDARMESTRMSSSNETVWLYFRSALRAPIVSFPRRTGTHTKAISASLRSSMVRVRLRNSGSVAIEGTTTGAPVSTTRPVTPSPRRYRALRR